MKRVLVTGAVGNVGREVVRECLSAGFAVRAAGQDIARLRASFPGTEPVRFDYRDRETWPAALAGCDFLFLLRPPRIADVEQTLNPFIDAAYQAGIQHIVFLSVMGADRMKWVPHRKVELHLAERERGWTILRPGFFAQNLQDAYLKDIVEDRRLFVPAGAGKVAFLDVRDIASVCARVLSEPEQFEGQALTLTGPAAITFEEVATALTGALGVEIRYQPASIPGYVRHLRGRRGLPWMQVLVQTVLHRGLRKGDAEAVDPTLRRILGRDGRTLRDYVTDSAAFWRTGERPVGGPWLS
jgi:uncharacterized protein YbjT (DUF2867 family)